MKTRVELWIHGEVTPVIEKEVRDLTKINTPNERGIKINRDEIDDSLLIIRFNSYSGKSGELAEQIMKSYSLYLDKYSDIAIGFETRKKGIDKSTDGITKKEVLDKIGEFYRLLDDKNWAQLQLLFLDKIEYLECQEGARITNEIGKKTSSNRYLNQKEKRLQGVITNHTLKEVRLSKRYGLIACEVDYLIQETVEDCEKENISMGKQEFRMQSIAGELKISKITDERKKH